MNVLKSMLVPFISASLGWLTMEIVKEAIRFVERRRVNKKFDDLVRYTRMEMHR